MTISTNKPVFPADPRFQEPVLAIDLLRGPQHGIRDPEKDPDPVGPVQEVPGGPHDDPGAVQPVLHQMHQAKRVQEADGKLQEQLDLDDKMMVRL